MSDNTPKQEEFEAEVFKIIQEYFDKGFQEGFLWGMLFGIIVSAITSILVFHFILP